MTIFSNFSPYFIKAPDEWSDVIISWGKNEEQNIADTAHGIARIGGDRLLDYHQAYLKSAAILIRYGKQYNSLDEVGLPAFYMQRHALELLIKEVLSWVYWYADLKYANDDILFIKQRKRYKNSHDLLMLFEDLRGMCNYFGFSEPPVGLGTLVQEIVSFEKSETWARYAYSEKKKEILHHLKDETILPLVEFQRKLEKISIQINYRADGEGFVNQMSYVIE